MKIKLCALILISCVAFSGCSLLPSRTQEVEYIYSIDTDTYIFCDDVTVNMFQLYDTLKINIAPEYENNDWRCLLEGFIKRFAYVDGVLILEFYDKWYTFDVKNFESENMCFDLKEYETEDKLKQIYPNIESLEWTVGRYQRTEENIKKNRWHEGFKETVHAYKDTLTEYRNISETDSNN